ncbi:MAG: tRNA (guanosine(46)-N7)-methyltransferase TrmB [Polyangiales bacterium]
MVTERTPLPDPRRYRAMAPVAPEGAIDLNAVLPGTGPVELDIGFGRGNSVIERAQSAPESRIIGIEIKTKWSFLVEQRCRSLGLDNVAIYCGDAKEILKRCLPNRCVQKVVVQFPDPWWKKRHSKRRVVDATFLDLIAPTMESGGLLLVQTDVNDRADLYHAEIDAHPMFRWTNDTGYVQENPFGARSNREVRADDDGLPIHRLLAERA